MEIMDRFGCDYECRTVGESIRKYNIPNDWCAEFDAYEDVFPIICIQIDEIRKAPAMMNLELRIIENKDEEYAGCIVLPQKKSIGFKVNSIASLVEAMQTMEIAE